MSPSKLPARPSYHPIETNFPALSGAAEKARDILDEIAAEGLRPNLRTFNSVVDIHAQKHDAAGARRAFDEMKAAGLHPNVVTYTSLMDAMMKSGDMDGAMGLLEEMKTAGVQPNKVRNDVNLAFDKRESAC